MRFLPTHLSAHSPTHLSIIHPPTHLPTHHRNTYPSIRTATYPFIHPTIQSFISQLLSLLCARHQGPKWTRQFLPSRRSQLGQKHPRVQCTRVLDSGSGCMEWRVDREREWRQASMRRRDFIWNELSTASSLPSGLSLNVITSWSLAWLFILKLALFFILLVPWYWILLCWGWGVCKVPGTTWSHKGRDHNWFSQKHLQGLTNSECSVCCLNE